MCLSAFCVQQNCQLVFLAPRSFSKQNIPCFFPPTPTHISSDIAGTDAFLHCIPDQHQGKSHLLLCRQTVNVNLTASEHC